MPFQMRMRYQLKRVGVGVGGQELYMHFCPRPRKHPPDARSNIIREQTGYQV